FKRTKIGRQRVAIESAACWQRIDQPRKRLLAKAFGVRAQMPRYVAPYGYVETHVPLSASAASTCGKIRNVRSSREVSKIERKVSGRPLRKNSPPYASTSCMAKISAAIPALSM